jgi:hypothetical protein
VESTGQQTMKVKQPATLKLRKNNEENNITQFTGKKVIHKVYQGQETLN